MKFRALAVCLSVCISGCATTTWNQSAVDIIPDVIDPGKAIVIFDATILESEENLLVIFKKPDRVESQSIIGGENHIEFTNYPGTVIPFYAGEEPHRLQAYHINAGDYEISGCVYEAPEVYRCVPGRWMQNGRIVGAASFSV